MFVSEDETKVKVGVTDKDGLITVQLKEMCQNEVVFENKPVYK